MLVEVDKELEAMFPRYLANREDDMLKAETALEKKDFESMRQLGHKICGNAAGYGLLDFGQMAKKLEQAASERKYDICRDLVKAMQRYLTDLKVKFV